MKKIFIFFIAFLFLISFTSANVKTIKSESLLDIPTDCEEDTLDVLEFMEGLDFDEETTICVSNLFYAECSGYSVNYDDCF